uniref:Aspartokinase n=1 Tax=Candidatus Actinomarina minuta TaxID=1389454 RepID=S5DN32_9ACTN|nr:aspartokinases [Candidatus Actinomarina minuta]
MTLIVQKYGGTSVADTNSLKLVAERIIECKEDNNDVVVVPSAMGSSTDELIHLASELSEKPTPREMDMLLSAGERITMSLLSMHLNSLGYSSFSLTGSQAGIITTSRHGKAEIEEITGERVKEGIDQGDIVIVAGFQGFNRDTREITTLGRGGSDATAVALAAALGAERCEIFTDVEGVYTADPRIITNAQLIDEITYDEMLEMSSSGAGVLMARSVEFGRRYNVPIIVKSTFKNNKGTLVKEKVMEEAIVSGVTHNNKEIKFTLFGVPDQPGIAGTVFGSLSEIGTNVDMIVQNVSKDSITDISFTAPSEQQSEVEEVLKQISDKLNAKGFDVDQNIGRVSIIGAGMKSESGVASKMFKILGESGINISMISTSPIRVSCVINSKDIDQALNVLHEEFITKK